ncbi:uncharacterized protein N0V89_000350 [Didymosphaeria variabile]|uniref:Telomere-associated protein Rif1 N-terminal domain-containing protein n=1 Tax=Didymosphaeria variabile TaxID=1932322 RepID=A0A9W9CFL7_9PLEO|nr:uncharacterized protein N0V89_000350 [Didymosphaeria variabile]KAJ4359794.1 hypothetical protein N0V89_000350 [Didymosphaeria variabile]
MVFSSSKFESLSVRPPTPPREIDYADPNADEVLDFLKDPFGTKEPVAKVIAAKTLLNTPQTSPSSESGIPSSSARSSSRKKKVNFEAQLGTTNGNAISSQSFIPLQSSPLRPLPQTRVSKPLKSILKPSDAVSTPPPADQDTPTHNKSFAEMLESVMKQLASQTRSNRFDGYHSLQRTMQAYEKVPDPQALVDKMGLMTQFIKRDMYATGVNGTGLDSQLLQQALKFLMALIRIQEARPAMPDEFCNFVVDRIIQVAADGTLPKMVINTHLAVLMQQNFRPRTMTPARVERILDVLDTIEDRVSGLSVLAYRVRIFRKLIQQRPEVMSKHTERWFKHTVKALLSTQKDINQSALDTIISAAKAFGNDRQVTKSVLTVMNKVRNDGGTYGMVKELQRMLGSDNAAMAPQVWSAVTSLLPGCLDGGQFSAIGEWLKVFQMFFNSAKEDVKIHANVALGFLAYAVQLTENTTPAFSKILVRVPHSQLENQRGKKPERDAATSAYFALLYHAFGPAATHKQLDRYWLEFVADFWGPLLHPSSTGHSSPKHAFAACRVASALFNGNRKSCDPQRTLDLRPQAMLQLQDLPTLDPKWVRKSLPSILEFVETLLDATPWTADDCKDEPAKTMWLSLLHSLNIASSQEVMVSNDSKDAMAYMVNFLRRVWDGHAAQLALSQQKEDSWADKYCFLLEMVLEKLGAVRFSDKCLTRNGQDDFEAAATPSQRSRQHGPRTSPLLYFVDLLINQSEGKLSDSLRLRALKVLIKPCFDAQNTRLSGLELLRDCSTLVDASTRTPLSDSFWSEACVLLTACLEKNSSDVKEQSSRQLGKEYDVVVEILSLGFPYLSKEPSGEQLLRSFADTVRREAGDGAVVLVVVEKVSESVLKRTGAELQDICMPFLSVILRNLPVSIARRIVEQGRQNLWPSSATSGRTADFDPYNHLYDVIVSVGSTAYQKINASDAPMTGNFLEALATSVRQCPPSLIAVYLRKTQETIRWWVEDPEKKLQLKTAWSKALYTSVLHLWEEVCAAMHKLPRNNGQVLLHLDPLITSGFVSRRREIVDSSIAAWNATFGREKSLRYPLRLEEALRRLRSTVELSLPGLEIRDGDDDIAPSFYDSDGNTNASEPKRRTPRVKETPFKIVKSSRKSRSKSRSPMVPSTAKKVSTGRTLKGRLRHENSQVQFEPIVSSPSNPYNQESQILTERQREVYERQMRSSNVYEDMRSVSPPPEQIALARSPLEFHSDAMSADGLPIEASRTPLRNVRALGEMEVFVGSSPTPQARTRSQEVVSERTSMATPIAIRTVQSAHAIDELGSSPPRFEKDNRPIVHGSQLRDDVEGFGGNLDEDGRYGAQSMSFDDGTTIDEDAFLTGTPDEDPDQVEEQATEIDATDMPSSTLDLQLTAQLDAEIQAQKDAAAIKTSSQLLPRKDEDTDVDLPVTDSLQSNTDTTSTSRVEDSFSSLAAEPESSQIRNLRRSQRHPSASSPQSANSKKRKSSSARGPGRPRKNQTEETKDNDVTTTRQEGMTSGIKSTPSATPAGYTLVVPDTTRNRSVRRSASLLSQVENQPEDVVVEDTPATKRARRSIDKDVSEAKQSTPSASQQLKTKRLSHVQVTPRHFDAPSPGRSSSAALEDVDMQQPANEPAPTSEASLEVGEQNANVTPQLANATPAASRMRDSQPKLASNSVATPSRSFAERVILTPRSIIDRLKAFKDALFGAPQLALNRQEHREVDDLMFDIRMAVHDAGKRGDEPSQ